MNLSTIVNYHVTYIRLALSLCCSTLLSAARGALLTLLVLLELLKTSATMAAADLRVRSREKKPPDEVEVGLMATLACLGAQGVVLAVAGRTPASATTPCRTLPYQQSGRRGNTCTGRPSPTAPQTKYYKRRTSARPSEAHDRDSNPRRSLRSTVPHIHIQLQFQIGMPHEWVRMACLLSSHVSPLATNLRHLMHRTLALFQIY